MRWWGSHSRGGTPRLSRLERDILLPVVVAWTATQIRVNATDTNVIAGFMNEKDYNG